MLRTLTVVLLLYALAATGQELPPVSTFVPDDYRGGSQNWAISQNGAGFIYVANNEGLLEYDGHRWHRYPSPNESILRSVAAVGDRIYTGSYMEFGYWARRPDGRLAYTSLSAALSDRLLPDEQFWAVISYRGAILFQSLRQLFVYRPGQDQLTVIRPAGGLARSFRVAEALYTVNDTGVVSVLEQGALREVAAPKAEAGGIIHLWSRAGRLWAQSATGGTFVVEGGGLTAADRFPFLAGRRIYSALSLADGGLAFGTVSSGLFVTAADGSLRYHLDRTNGLTNNTVLALFQDADRNVWVAADNGINCLNLASPVRRYTDRSGRLGTVYAAARYRGRTYLGSNQGLFVQEGDTYRLLPGTRGQVWSLFPYGEVLFCGHDAGTFIVEGEDVRQLSGAGGSWTFRPAPGRPDLLVVGGYRGLSVLQRSVATGWRYRNSIRGFPLSARYLALRRGPEAYISHEYRGIYGLRIDRDYRRVTDSIYYTEPAKGQHGGLATFRDSVYYSSRGGLYVLRDWQRGFARHPKLSNELAGRQYLSGRMSETGERLWLMTAAGPAYVTAGPLDGELRVETLPIRAEATRAPTGFENFTVFGADSLLIGTADGYLLLDRSALALRPPAIFLTGVAARPDEGSGYSLPLAGGARIPYSNHNLAFELSVPDYRAYVEPRFRYRLPGRRTEWSEWGGSQINFTALGFGDYVLEVQAMLGDEVSERTIQYAFTILRPWYATYPAILVYLLTAAVLIYLLHRSYLRYFHRKERSYQLEQERILAARERQAELEVTRLNNERLRKDIEAKNREAALSTMNLVKKNELLQRIKQDLLTGTDTTKNIREVVRTIDRSIDEGETWKLFREAFENADRDFFKKIKVRHPELTPNDLKVCAYLRLNLSSKEIASLLNISPRSVEVKRYRLRKRMGLPREANLVDYILGV